jgi:spoIIIJ-associated protein
MMDATEQCETVDEFLRGLSAAFGLETTVSSSIDEDGIIRTDVDGSEVGLLIGPRLGTLEAVQEICRNVLQRKADGREHGKVVLDVSQVREMRRKALEEFVSEAAETVRTEGREVVFEVMSSGDRKVVHDTVAELDGVESTSIGEDPRRRVVVRPA